MTPQPYEPGIGFSNTGVLKGGVEEKTVPQSSAALRQKAEAMRLLRNPHAPVRSAGTTPNRPIRAKKNLVCLHGTCQALDVRADGLWVQVRDTDAQEAWAPIARILSPELRREWARNGFG